MPVELKSEAELEQMRRAGRINAEVRALLMEAVKPGVTGIELDELATREIEKRGAIATFKGYAPRGAPPYPGAICFSVNEELVHGIPGDRALKEGDIVSIDVGATFQGWVSDAAFTAAVGEVSAEALDLINTTREALWCGIETAKIGNRLGDVSYAIGNHAGTYGIIDEYGGHGVGREMHEEPHILNKGRPGAGMQLRKGMVIALEPMFATGHPATKVMPDRWTVVMSDGGLSAHWEETVAITANGPEVLTRI
ncbi:MAG: type I methionyl aminopeptidase [Chloroflexi bacterium]|nr:type I methionyl aminopeptidase [Chloroflexota bacterium]MDA1145454.1 type I methionyl aminopeptidase [Chloroflexota bacterium]